MAIRFSATGASSILLCIAVAACASPTESPTPRNPSVPVGTSARAPSRDASSVAYQFTTAGGSDVYKCHGGKCRLCIEVSSFCRNLGTGPSGKGPNSGPAGLIAVATFDQAVLILDQDCNKTRTLNDTGFLRTTSSLAPTAQLP
jgi:hypothetical protein